jgi:paraquat-inducible protein B
VLPAKKRRVQLIWIIPAVAVLIGAWLTVRSYLETGPTIAIRFKTAEGLEAGKTKLRYKSVDIGQVKGIDIASDGKGVIVAAELRSNAGKLLVKDTRFWIVRARVAGGQISGLGTLLSGSYIGVDVGKSPDSARNFEGLDNPPPVTADEPGREFILRSSTLGSLDIGAPVYYRLVPVGQVTAFDLDEDGKAVVLRIFIHSPYEKFVTEATRFWHASGLDVSIGASGFQVKTQSFVSILLGGVAFQEAPEGREGREAPPALPERLFTLYPEQASAMKRLDTEAMPFVAYFSDSVRGLSPGVPIELQGIVIGDVKSVDLQFDPGTMSFRFPVELNLYADRLQSKDPKYAKEPFDGKNLIARLIERGLRAQMRSGNLLTGQRYVALDFFPNAKPVRVDRALLNGKGVPVMPTVPGNLEELQVTLANIAKKIDKVPFDEIGVELKQTLKKLQTTMESADTFVQHLQHDVTPELGAAMAEAKKTLSAAEKVLANDAPVQQDVRAALREMTKAAQSVRVLTDYLQLHPQSLIFGKPAEKNDKEKTGTGR